MTKNRIKGRRKREKGKLRELRDIMRSYDINPALARAAAVLRKGIDYIVIGDTRDGAVYCLGSLPVAEAKREEDKAVKEWNYCPDCKRFWKPASKSSRVIRYLGGEKSKNGRI